MTKCQYCGRPAVAFRACMPCYQAKHASDAWWEYARLHELVRRARHSTMDKRLPLDKPARHASPKA